ncbi:MAG: hypothetical protein WCH44_02845 [Betaproteobacteria bacterium]
MTDAPLAASGPCLAPRHTRFTADLTQHDLTALLAMQFRTSLMELAATGFNAVADSITSRLVHPEHLHDPAIVNVIRDMAHCVGVDAFMRQQMAIMVWIDRRAFLYASRCAASLAGVRAELSRPQGKAAMEPTPCCTPAWPQ